MSRQNFLILLEQKHSTTDQYQYSTVRYRSFSNSFAHTSNQRYDRFHIFAFSSKFHVFPSFVFIWMQVVRKTLNNCEPHRLWVIVWAKTKFLRKNWLFSRKYTFDNLPKSMSQTRFRKKNIFLKKVPPLETLYLRCSVTWCPSFFPILPWSLAKSVAKISIFCPLGFFNCYMAQKHFWFVLGDFRHRAIPYAECWLVDGKIAIFKLELSLLLTREKARFKNILFYIKFIGASR